MRSTLRITTIALAVILLPIGFVSSAQGQCAMFPWNKATTNVPAGRAAASLQPASLPPAADQKGSDDRIVGFWKVKFSVADGTVIDNGFVQWHADGTEIMNSSRPPATGNFCLGVWRKSGSSNYELNHFALSFDPGGSLVGPAQIRESLTLERGGDRYEGTFTIDQFDTSGNPLAHVEGRVTGARISVDTPVADVL
jgi:hypothetical protein